MELKDDQEMIYQLTKFDLINRILGLSDLNQGNYGVLDNGIQRSIKIVDFRAPGQPISLNNTIFKSYFNANGKIYQSNDRLITNILKNKSKDQKVEEGKDTIKKLGLSVEQFENTVLEVKTYIENFISETDKVSNVSIKKQIGLNSDDELEELDIYADTIVSNFRFVKNYFGN